MVWRGEFAFGDAFAVYVGPPDDNDIHEHAAYQIVLGHADPVQIEDECGTVHSGSALIVRPMMPHALRGKGSLTIAYLDPQASQALQLEDLLHASDITQLDPRYLPFDTHLDPARLLGSLNEAAETAPSALDTRLATALSELRNEPGQISIKQAAALGGVSESRLRTLAREQLGVPLSTWLVWRKLETAAVALADGASLADAAYAGGFSDQAHFSRAMKRMFGITPSVAARSLAAEP